MCLRYLSTRHIHTYCGVMVDCLLGLLRFALCPAALWLMSSTVLLIFWSASVRPAAVMSWWETVLEEDILVEGLVVCSLY
jgi:hypothetical protein